MKRTLAAAIAALAIPAAAAAQGADNGLAYVDGVVTDDDLVPGRPPNEAFLGGEQAPGAERNANAGRGAETGLGSATIRPNSPNLIGEDGRIAGADE